MAGSERLVNEPIVNGVISYPLLPHEIAHVRSMVHWFYANGIIPEPSADALGRYAMAKLSQEFLWMSEKEAGNGNGKSK